MFASIFVSDGATLTPASKTIAVSPDGIKWTYLQKSQVKNVTSVYIPGVGNSEAQRGYPFTDSAMVHIELTNGSTYKFDVQSVNNHNSWVTAAQKVGGTATTVEDGLQTAVNDIVSYL